MRERGTGKGLQEGGAAEAPGWRPCGPLLEPPRSILLVMLSALGDAVMTLPVLNALRRTFPDAFITWVLQPGFLPLVQGHPAADRIVPFHRERGRTPGALLRSGRGLLQVTRNLREVAREQEGGAFDLLLDLQVYLKAGLLTALAPARIKLGFDFRRARDMNWLFTTHRIPPHPRGFGHVQDQYFEFLAHLGIEPDPLEYGLVLTPEERAAQAEFFGPLADPVCSLVLATSRPVKNWSARGYAAVARGVKERLGLQPVLVGGRSPGEEAVAREIRRLAPGVALDARSQDLRRLLWLLDGSTVVVSPDTGPLHMARALEVPVIGLFGATNPRRSCPYRKYEDLVVDGYARYPGESYGKEPGVRPGGMAKITPEMVLEKVELALGTYGTGFRGNR